MADKILMNKNTLAALKGELREYHTALPVFEMKEQQLKEMVHVLENNVFRLTQAIEAVKEEIQQWIGVMSEETVDLSQFVKLARFETSIREVAGVSIQEFENISYEDREVDLLNTPLWVDTAMEVIRDQKTNYLLVEMEKKNLQHLRDELMEARRMKNALKEVFIPEAQENIRKIEIYLGDVERLAIGCAKLVKKKKQEKNTLA